MDTAASPYVIAEAGVNHNGSLERALAMVEAAAAAGADAVKFQSFRAERLVTTAATKAAYQRAATGEESGQLEMLRALELSAGDHRVLMARCEALGIEFLSTPFDLESLAFLAGELGVARLKLPSGEITNGPLLLAAARSGLPIILSTGMSTLAEVEEALRLLAFGYLGGERPDLQGLREAYASAEGQARLAERVTLLHCTTEYPAPFEELNLRAMRTLAEAFGLPVGLSDHSEGIVAAVAAVALGAGVVEKHFTLDRSLPGPDHRASLEPAELGDLVAALRRTHLALGSPVKRPTPRESGNLTPVRKSLVALRPIRAGEPFTDDNLGTKRPGGGLSPMRHWELLGRPARRDYEADEAIEP